jgi:hypothetical protein
VISPAAVFASQAVVLLAGYALLRALGIAELKRADVRLVGLSYLAGWASTGVLLSLGLVLGVGESLPEILVLVTAQTVICFWLGRRSKPVGPPERVVVQSRHPVAVAVCWASGGMIAIAIASAAAVASKVEWDAWQDFDAFNFWVPKAEVVYLSHGLDVGLWKLFAHAEYPPLVPAMDASTFFFAGLHPSVLVAQRTLLGIAFLLSVAVLLARHVPRWLLLPFLAALATATWFWPQLRSLMVDAPVAYLVGVAATAGFLWLHERRRCWLLLAAVFLAAAGLTKFEGFFFAEILALTLGIAAILRYGRRGLPTLALVAAPLLIVVWWVWLGAHGVSAANSGDYHLSDVFNLHFLSERSYRLGLTLSAFGTEVDRLAAGAFSGWHVPGLPGWVLLLPLGLALALSGRRHDLLAGAGAAWALCAFAGLAVIYWIGRPALGWYINVTLDRVAPTIAVAAVAVATLVLGLELGEHAERMSSEPKAAPRARLPHLRGRMVFALSAALAALVVLALADSRPGVARTGTVDPAALGRELTAQFKGELASAGYLYPLKTQCTASQPGGLDYLCLVSTLGPVGVKDPKILYWNVSVTCAPRRSAVPRCSTDHGEALG